MQSLPNRLQDGTLEVGELAPGAPRILDVRRDVEIPFSILDCRQPPAKLHLIVTADPRYWFDVAARMKTASFGALVITKDPFFTDPSAALRTILHALAEREAPLQALVVTFDIATEHFRALLDTCNNIWCGNQPVYIGDCRVQPIGTTLCLFIPNAEFGKQTATVVISQAIKLLQTRQYSQIRFIHDDGTPFNPKLCETTIRPLVSTLKLLGAGYNAG